MAFRQAVALLQQTGRSMNMDARDEKSVEKERGAQRFSRLPETATATEQCVPLFTPCDTDRRSEDRESEKGKDREIIKKRAAS